MIRRRAGMEACVTSQVNGQASILATLTLSLSLLRCACKARGKFLCLPIKASARVAYSGPLTRPLPTIVADFRERGSRAGFRTRRNGRLGPAQAADGFLRLGAVVGCGRF
jgi:hypothetical protein